MISSPLQRKQAVIVRFEGVFYSIVLVLGFWEDIDGAVPTRLLIDEGYRRKRWKQRSAAFIGLKHSSFLYSASFSSADRTIGKAYVR